MSKKHQPLPWWESKGASKGTPPPPFSSKHAVHKSDFDADWWPSPEDDEIPIKYKPTRSYGGVVIDLQGRVLLRAPKNFFGGYAWTHAKGGQDKGETAEETAVREVLEETGWLANVVAEIPKDYPGSTTITRYFLMEPVEKVQAPDAETFRVAWFTIGGARNRIQDTQHLVGQQRDLDVLERAWTIWQDLHASPPPRSNRSRRSF